MICRFCGEEVFADDLLHSLRCDGQQGTAEALHNEAAALPQIVEDPGPRRGSLTERAERFHARNPTVYTFALSILRYVKRRGLKRYGIGAVWETIRFKYLETHGDIYKLNNNHRAWYSRQILLREADMVGFLRIRDCPNDPEYHRRPVIVARGKKAG